MALIKSISGIRGTIGGPAGENLTPQDIVDCTAGFGELILQSGAPASVVVGRDARVSGEMVSHLVVQTLIAQGISVLDLGLSTTPTVEMAVTHLGAGAGIIITASHNPAHWNALKFLNQHGEFISAENGRQLLEFIEAGNIHYADVENLGQYRQVEGMIAHHIEQILALPFVETDIVRDRKFKVVVDCINSTGAIAVPPLLEALGCEYVLLNAEVNGRFAHNPEPLPAHLESLCSQVVAEKADLGIAVDPDVDRLALVCEDGSLFGEEYTLVAVADYILQKQPGGNTVSNLSSSRALRDVTQKYGGQYFAAAVGEVNVVAKMKATGALIGGEGNGGVIVPDLHYGRDALAGIALVLSQLASSGQSLLGLKSTYPDYHMIKDKITLPPGTDMEQLLSRLHEKYATENCTTIDGLKIDFQDSWVHLRQSNTEPIIRVYAEAREVAQAQELADKIKHDAQALL
ncbi:MAG: phosphoglucosamine mutase [Saprospiraceae bacterium]|nr:phosphoglucosamine mutase [Saprospiraceae bacterium]